MTGGARTRSRWIGRASILENHPAAPQSLRLLVLTLSFLGLQLVWSCQLSQASPYLIALGFSKATMALVFLAGPLSGLIVQPVVGAVSDACRSRLGRRRPFIIGGCVISSAAVLVFGRTREVAGLFTTPGGSAHTFLTKALAILSIYAIDFSINVVQAVDRFLLVDVMPYHLQADANAWASRLGGIGGVVGYWIGGADLVYWTAGWLGSDQLKVLTLFTVFFLCATHAVTCICVQERVLISRYDESEHQSGYAAVRAIADIRTTLVTLPRPIQQVFNIQFTAWIGWFPVLFFGTAWIAETYAQSNNNTDLVDAPVLIQQLATRAGSQAMFYNSLIALFASLILPALVAPSSDTIIHSPAASSFPLSLQSYLDRLFPLSWLSMGLLWTISNGCLASLLFLTYFATSVGSASTIIALTGFSWAVAGWAPFAILGELISKMGAGPSLTAVEHHPLWDIPPASSLDYQNRKEDSTSSELWERNASDTPPRREPKRRELEMIAGRKREGSPTETETSDAFFDAASSAGKSDQSFQHPYGESRSSLAVTMEPPTAVNDRLQQFSASSSTIFFHPDSFPSHLSIDNSACTPTNNRSHDNLRTPTTLQLLHDDPFDDSSLNPSSNRRGSVSPGQIEGGEEGALDWELSEREMDIGGGSDQAGVILGCHNIYLVLPQLIITGVSAIIFAILAPGKLVLGSPVVPIAVIASEIGADGSIEVVARLLARQEVMEEGRNGWDALGLIFRLGGISVAVATWMCWKMTKEFDERERRS